MIIILIISRSGSSMIAKIFAAHGVKNKMSGDYPYEDWHIKKWLRDSGFKQDHGNPKPVPDWLVSKFQPFIKAHNTGFWKGDAFEFPLFEPLNPKILTIIRDLDCAAASLQDKNPSAAKQKTSEVKRLQQLRYDYAASIINKYGGVTMYADEIVDGNYASLKAAMEYCGITFDPEKADKIIDPSKWHFHRDEGH